MKGTPKVGIFFKSTGSGIKSFVDTNWGACPDDRRSFTGYTFTLNGDLITWEQKTVALSSTETEYMAFGEAVKEALYLRRLISEISGSPPETIDVFNDNVGAHSRAIPPSTNEPSTYISVTTS